MRIVELNKMYGYNLDGVLREAVYKYETYHDIYVMSYLKREWDTGKFRYKIEIDIEL